MTYIFAAFNQIQTAAAVAQIRSDEMRAGGAYNTVQYQTLGTRCLEHCQVETFAVRTRTYGLGDDVHVINEFM